MKIVTDKPFGLSSKEDFIGMGVVSDSGKDYVCLLDLAKATEAVKQSKEATSLSSVSMCCYVEEVRFKGRARNWTTAESVQIENDEEWAKLVAFVMHNTTIFSPKKIKDIVEGKAKVLTTGPYIYSKDYLNSKELGTVDKKTGKPLYKDLEYRKRKGLI